MHNKRTILNHTNSNTAVLYITISLYLPSNVGRWSGDLCQHRGIHLLANDIKSAFPFTASNGGRLPFTTAGFISSLVTALKINHQTQHSYSDHSWLK